MGIEYPLNWTCVATKEELLHRAHQSMDILAGIIFRKDDPKLLTFDIYVNHTLAPYSLNNFSASAGIPVNSTATQWLTSGIVALQHSVQMSVTKVSSLNSNTNSNSAVDGKTYLLDLSFRQEPYEEYRSQSIGFSVGQIAPMYFVIIAAITSQSWMKTILLEKEKQLRERLLVSGLSMTTLTLTWMATFALKGIVFFLAGSGVGIYLVSKSDYTISVLVVLLFTCSIITLVVMLSTLFSSAKVGVTFYTFSVMIPAVLFNYVTNIALSLRILLALLWSPITFVFSFQQLFAADAYDKQGIHWHNINQPVSRLNGGFSVLVGMFVLILNTVLYGVLAMYFNRVIPGNGGRTKSCCFCLSKLFKSKAKVHDFDTIFGSDDAAAENNSSDDAHAKGNVERPEIGLVPGVSIQQLRKTFKTVGGEDVHAVDGLTLDMYDSQVTALLGHNGAGKTTTMSLLTGMLDVTSGDADIYGASLSEDVDDIRKMVGICTQHNLLWEKLTVLEHLQLFGAIRGTAQELIDEEAIALATKVGLGSKLNAHAKALSGGMKRKLSVALALIGNPKVVFLDEPTAG